MKRILGLWLVLVFGLGLMAGVKTVPLFKAKEANYVPNEILVTFTSKATDAEKLAISKNYGLTKVKESWKKGRYTLYKHESPDSVIRLLNELPQVKYAESNHRCYPLMIPNDTYYSLYQWNFPLISMPSAWDLSTGSGVVVAVLDTGVYQGFTDFAGTNFTAGYDFADDDTDPTDEGGWSDPASGGNGSIFSHGSHVAGTIAQTTNNSLGCAGIAYDVTIMPIRVLSTYSGGLISDVADGIDYAVANGADIINMSLGMYYNSNEINDACDDAWNAGVLVIAAAGNEATSSLSYPASYDSVMSVSATTNSDVLASYSNYGSKIEISAPGGEPTGISGDYIWQQAYSIPSGLGFPDLAPSHIGYIGSVGTSMAAPHVAGVAALMKSVKPTATNQELRNALIDSAVDLGDPGWDIYFGHGRLNAYYAVKKMFPYFHLDRWWAEMHIWVPPWVPIIYRYVDITISIVDTANQPVAGVNVYGQWSGLVRGSAYGVSDAKGQVVLTSPYTRSTSGTFTLSITRVDCPTAGEYNPRLNTIPTTLNVSIGRT